MNIAAFIFALAGVALNFFQPVSNNYLGNATFGGFFIGYIESMGGFVLIFGIFSIKFFYLFYIKIYDILKIN